MSTNAEKHVAALVAQFGPPPFVLENFACGCLALAAVGNSVHARIEWAPGRVDDWVVPDPEILVPDPAGPVVRLEPVFDPDSGLPVIDPATGAQATVEAWFREDPIAVATAELASFLRAVRG